MNTLQPGTICLYHRIGELTDGFGEVETIPVTQVEVLQDFGTVCGYLKVEHNLVFLKKPKHVVAVKLCDDKSILVLAYRHELTPLSDPDADLQEIKSQPIFETIP